ncbi:MAG: hypothetical protein ACRD6X_03205, partial [Pyrinomonadaceae bacterium]
VKDSQDDSYRKEFAELPLEKKIANLVHLEAITFTETLAFVVNSPFTVIDKIGDVLAEFGLNKETAEKQQKRAASETKSSRSAPRKRKSPPKPDAAI